MSKFFAEKMHAAPVRAGSIVAVSVGRAGDLGAIASVDAAGKLQVCCDMPVRGRDVTIRLDTEALHHIVSALKIDRIFLEVTQPTAHITAPVAALNGEVGGALATFAASQGIRLTRVSISEWRPAAGLVHLGAIRTQAIKVFGLRLADIELPLSRLLAPLLAHHMKGR